MSFTKDPQAVLDYEIDWSAWLTAAGDDTISASSWTATTGITIDSDSNTTTTATVWLSGGTAGNTSEITNHIAFMLQQPRFLKNGSHFAQTLQFTLSMVIDSLSRG
jgi:hypothetical protein